MLLSINSSNSLTNVVYSLLKPLKVKVARSTIKATLETHPDYPGILSISDALKQWKVDNSILRIDKEKLHEIPLPFIAHLQAQTIPLISIINQPNPFVTITNVTHDNVVYTNNTGGGKTLNKTIEQFLQEWSGVALLAEATEQSGEKNYKQTRRWEILKSLKFPSVMFIVLAFTLLAINHNNNSISFPAYSIFLFLKFLGSFFCALLLWYEIDKASPLLKQICSMSKQTNCAAVLNSKQAKLFKVISWSEIGFFYFAGGFVSLLAASTQSTNVLSVLVWLNVIALPYTIFSIYYQWKVVKQWCTLCLGVQSLLIGEFITALTTKRFILPTLNFELVTILLPSFLLPIILWFVLKPVLLQNEEAKQKKKELLRLKHDTRIFNALLSQQRQITTTSNGLGITIGNRTAMNTLIKVCNPYCGPCAKAHPEIEALLEANDNLKVQILFTATNNEEDISALPVKHLLSIADKDNEVLTKQALDDWYLADKKEYETFAAKYPMNGELKKQDLKIEAMSKWCNDVEIAFTPTLFINGYQLPENYRISDLQYLLSN
jgi:uncharacterized membrane protein